MPLYGTNPVESFPACVKVNLREGAALNAVGFSGPGAKELLSKGRWYAQLKPFVLSFMAVEKTRSERREETRQFGALLKSFLPFKAPVALQVNFSCPNVGLEPWVLVDEIADSLRILSSVGIPLIAKINALVPPDALNEIVERTPLDALSVSNTLPWGSMPDQIPWARLFGKTSPLAHLGGGGLSGAPLLPIVEAWIRDCRLSGFDKPILGGGGVLSKSDATRLIVAGADAIELGSVSMLRPWRVQGIIRHVNKTLG